MSISIRGKLRVKRINGANGPFCVGDLATEIGDFRVKDALLDQFDEGTYEGTFWIDEIFPWSYSNYGRMVIEIRAKLADLQIDEHDAAPVVQEPSEPDPALERKEPVPTPVPAPDVPSEPAVTKPSGSDEKTPPSPAVPSHRTTDSDLVALFGEELAALVAAGDPVKLDPTIDRMQFRSQRDRLKALGYSFQAEQQSWVRSS